MKNLTCMVIKSILLLVLIGSSTAYGQNNSMNTIKIKTSAVCEECKMTIEKALAFEKGVKKSELDISTNIITVSYFPEKTTPEKIRKAIADAGYDADEVVANPKAYKKLSACCKKENKLH